MVQPQLIFDRTIKTKQEMKELNLMIKDALANSKQYQDILEDIAELKSKQNKIKEGIMDDFNSELNKLDTLKLDVENDKMLLSDATLSKILKGEKVEVEDDRGNKYQPIFKVTYKRI